jgi:fengycin family lipopeptide synthetase D/gramicidin S synthase 2/tyrocidine synthetase-3
MIPLIEIFRRPTIRQQSEYIKNREKKSSRVTGDNLVLLGEKSGRFTSLFFVHDSSGGVEGYIEFCQHLKANFNYWGIQADRLENDAPWNLSIEEVARKYVQEIKKVQSRDHYFIAGWSLGGTIAFEMVRQLERMGKKIAFLALIDSPAPRESSNEDVQEFTLESEKNFIRKYLLDRKIEAGLENITDIKEIWPFIIDYLKSNSSAVKIVKKALIEYEAHVGFASHQWEISPLIRYLNTGRSFHRARVLYIPDGRIHTPVYYFYASQSKGIGEGWHDYCRKPMNVYEISGDHFSIFRKPQITKFAEIFCNIIKQKFPHSCRKNLWQK